MKVLSQVISTFFYVGYLRPAPGTWGSLAALPIGIYVLIFFDWQTLLALCLVTFFIGVWASGYYAGSNHKKDPSEVVIDEVAGQWLALVFVNPLLWELIAAFALFRLFDIAKPWLIGRLERLPAGWGIMSDDMLAGLFAGILIMLFRNLQLF